MTQGATKGLLYGPNLLTSENSSFATLLYFFGKSLRCLLVYARSLFNHSGAIFFPLNCIFQFLHEAYCQCSFCVCFFCMLLHLFFGSLILNMHFKYIVLQHRLLIVQLSLCSSTALQCPVASKCCRSMPQTGKKKKT